MPPQMLIRVLGAFGSEGPRQHPSAFLVNERTLLDAGTVPKSLTLPEQFAVEHAVISHAHLDHVAGLAYLAETLALCDAARPVTVSAIAPVVDGLRTSLFNNTLWPDFATVPVSGPVIRYQAIEAGRAHRVGALSVTPIAVDHSVPATGFLVEDDTSALIYSGDTGPTNALWQAARSVPNLGAVILECAFPNRMERLAGLSGHMTPARIARELSKLPSHVPVWIFHVKGQFYEETAAELARVDRRRISLLEQDKTYTV